MLAEDELRDAVLLVFANKQVSLRFRHTQSQERSFKFTSQLVWMKKLSDIKIKTLFVQDLSLIKKKKEASAGLEAEIQVSKWCELPP